MSANGTAALATLTPSTNVKVGDTVIDPEGEVFQIASLAASTFTVGARLANVRGPQGPKGDQGTQGERGPTGPAGTTTWAGITGKPTLGALSAKDKITIADFEGDIDLGSTT